MMSFLVYGTCAICFDKQAEHGAEVCLDCMTSAKNGDKAPCEGCGRRYPKRLAGGRWLCWGCAHKPP